MSSSNLTRPGSAEVTRSCHEHQTILNLKARFQAIVPLTPSKSLVSSPRQLSSASHPRRYTYLGSKPELARKDSHTYCLGQIDSLKLHRTSMKRTDRTNFNVGIFAGFALGLPTVMLNVPLGSCISTPDASRGRGGMVESIPPHLARHRTSGCSSTFFHMHSHTILTRRTRLNESAY
jgi:hypothetical protein